MVRLPGLLLAALVVVGGIAAAAATGTLLWTLVAFAGMIAFLVLYGTDSATWRKPADTRRADQYEEHPMPDGPFPPGPS